MDCLLIGKILYFMWFIVSITVIYNQVKTNTRETYFESKKEILCEYDKYITDQQTITICNNTSLLLFLVEKPMINKHKCLILKDF